jgi:alpha-tubulin suppressor-like RCC1 family protein
MRLRVLLLCLLTACAGREPVGPNDPQVALVTVTPDSGTLISLGETVQLVAVARDAQGDTIAGVTFTWTSNADGVAQVSPTGLVTAVANGTVQISAAAEGVTGQAALAVAQEVSAVTVSPGTVTVTAVGVPQQFTAAAVDGNSNAVSGVKFLWVSSDQDVATIDTNGVATGRGPGVATITAAARGVPGNAVLTIEQLAHHLVFSVEPGTVTAGEPFATALEVEVRDSADALVTDSRASVTLSLGANPGADTLRGATTVRAVNGIATFSNVWLTRATTGYILAANAPSIGAGASDAFAVTHTVPAQLAFEPLPTPSAGAPLNVQIALKDRFGNTATGAYDAIKVKLFSGPAGAALFGDTVYGTSQGVATVNATSAQIAGTYRLRASSFFQDTVVSSQFAVRPAAPAIMTFNNSYYLWHVSVVSTQLDSASSPVVTVRDAYGNRADTVSRPITIELIEDPWKGATGPGTVLDGTLTQLTNGGIATFNFLTLDRPVSARLRVTADGLLPDTSGTVTAVLGIGTVQSVNTGYQHSCVTTQFRGLFCWGSDANDELGAPSGTPAIDSVAIRVRTATTFASVTGGGGHTCGLTAAGAAWCWGLNADGQLGDGGAGATAAEPIAVAGGLTFWRLDAGGTHTCGLTVDSLAYCWGDNGDGQLGDGNGTTDAFEPVAVSGGHKYFSLSAGDRHTCGVAADSTLYCWGTDDDGRLGDGGANTASNVPVQLAAFTSKAVMVTAGGAHSCAVAEMSAGNDFLVTWCWGANGSGQLGDGNIGISQSVPVTADTGSIRMFKSFGFATNEHLHRRLSAGALHNCAVQDNRAYCWGANDDGQVGANSATTSFDVPTRVSTLGTSNWDRISAGGSHSCGMIVAHTGSGLTGVHCWGRNAEGQVGDASTTKRLAATASFLGGN